MESKQNNVFETSGKRPSRMVYNTQGRSDKMGSAVFGHNLQEPGEPWCFALRTHGPVL